MFDGGDGDEFTEEEATAIVGQCDPNITPIFPVRYALTLDALTAFKDSTPDLAAPTGLGGGNYDLRRLRRGFVYIYCHSGHQDGMHSDTDGKWLVFRYETRSGDENSEATRSDTETNLPGAYKFTQYEWEDGTPSSEWVALPLRRYPYAFVNHQVSDVHIAYSEERWPAWFFERMAAEASLRDVLMTQVNLVAETTAHSAPLTDIADHVTGFGEQEPDPIENAMRHTALQPEDYGTVVNCPNAHDNGRLVALMDPLGEILDLGRIHAVYAQSKQFYAANYAYPLHIGAAVKRHEAQIIADTEGGFQGFMRNNPISPDFSSTYDELLTSQQGIDQSLKNVAEGIIQIICRDGPAGILAEHTLALDGLTGVTDRSSFERAEYAAFIMGRALEPLGASTQGSQELMGVVDPTLANRTGTPLTTAFKLTMDIYSKFDWNAGVIAARPFTNSRAPQFDVLIQATANEIAVHWARGTGDPYFIKGAVQRVSLIREAGVATVAANELDSFLRTSYRNLGFTSISAQAEGIGGQGVSVDIQSSDISPQNTITTRRFSQGGFTEFSDVQSTVDITLNEGSARQLAVEGNVQRAGTGVGLVLALVIALDAGRSWKKTQYTITDPGAWATNPQVVIGTAVFDVFTSTAQWRELRNTRVFTNGVSSQIFNKLFTGNRFLTSATTTAGTRYAGSAMAVRSWGTLLGRAAGAVGIVLSAFNMVEAFYSGDVTALVGHTFMAAGGAVMLASSWTGVGALVGFVMIAIGLAITIFSYSPIEKWVSSSFWGDSNMYWHENWRDVTALRPSIEDQIEMAKALVDENDRNHSRIKGFYERELRDYARIMAPPTIINATAGDFAVEIDYPPATDLEAFEDLDIRVNFGFYPVGGRQSGTGLHNTSTNDPNRIRFEFIGPGVMRATLTPFMRDFLDRYAPTGTEHEIGRVRVQCHVDEKYDAKDFAWPM